ncbi:MULTISPECIES: DUF4189 domain-containing protein [Achromobacter]|jgi:hypothetical protein|uniref:DUF4189 domain-containing protein n=1 Tax=Achromobacter aegrifaciens TaxID=1287736 RepID=A0ABU2DLQ7_ACHAE|nr:MULTISPECIES: DUF4189 domain-containing protein [Achromobacter]PTN48747.1 hypothetical protein DAI43_28205 [Achromobacter xylosoxidans]MBD9385358.1 DUF4189 domain-containing protein [Achromobacter sp. ACM02]MBD9423572.1 DUF4189 domain-containing protein [Achromobacter sp. ACM04]MBD9434337.1 DUF4189 domain-containing protein [Achromobacter sp. ACM03]MBD9477212.1 DUF4189 domain-containing protein [Achromobacter sp. ACM01]
MKRAPCLALVFAALVLIAARPAAAEQGCGDGYTMSTQGPAQCIPIPGLYQVPQGGGVPPPPPRPQGHWETRWGAFASSKENLVGMAGNRGSEREATKAAIAHCVSKGGTDCKTAMTFYNQCAIVASGAVGNGQYFTMFRKHYTIEQATDDAMDICKEKNLTECTVHFSNCSQAEFIQ